jgi:biopolymer transport protein ExbB
MIGTFEVITEHGTGDPQLLSGGISVALITTQMGLIVAIPTVLAGQWTRSRCSSLMGELELGALTLVNLLADEADKQPPAEAILEKAVG